MPSLKLYLNNSSTSPQVFIIAAWSHIMLNYKCPGVRFLSPYSLCSKCVDENKCVTCRPVGMSSRAQTVVRTSQPSARSPTPSANSLMSSTDKCGTNSGLHGGYDKTVTLLGLIYIIYFSLLILTFMRH